MSSINVNYIDTYVEYPVLTKVYGKSTYETLQELKKQLKTNTSTATSGLGGGTNGHLRLVCTPAEYVRVNLVPYV